MANIRTAGDDPNNNPRQPLNDSIENLGNSLLQRNLQDPRKESFMQMLYINLCPYLSLVSFAAIIGVIITIMFSIQLGMCGINPKGEFLEPQRTSITEALSASYNSVIEKRQIWKLLTLWLVHPSFPSLVFTTIMLVVWGSYIESFLGMWRTLVIFFLTIIAGSAFGIIFAAPGDYFMGAKTGFMGLVGAALGYLIFNWNNLRESRFPKFFMLWLLIFIIFFSLILNVSLSQVLLEAGGILSGIFCGLFLSPVYVERNEIRSNFTAHEKVTWILGLSLYSFFSLISFFFIWILKKKAL